VTGVLLDTHAWVWTLTDESRLSRPAREAIERADAVMVSPISFFEIAQKVRIGRWPELADRCAGLPELLRESGGIAAPLTPEICVRAGLADWDHRDAFDRLLAATAESLALPLLTRDPVFAGRPGLAVVW
jgi:PIN domain nuclease of toxin-antitoxin system